MNGKIATAAVATAVAFLLLGSAPALASGQGQGNGLARGHLYSTAAVNGICEVAQGIVASTSLEAGNQVFTAWDAFEASDATPYQLVFPFEPWGSPQGYDVEEAPDLPLTATQHVIYGAYGRSGRTFPQVVSCKMKSAEYLQRTALDTGAADQPCSAVHEYYVNEVVASLTNPEEAQYILEPDESIEVDDQADQGPLWTAGFPEDPYDVLYRTVEDGPIHLKSRRLLVGANPFIISLCNLDIPPGGPGTFPDPSACQPRKWGVRYCHLAAPEYIRAAFTGEVDVPILPGGP